MELSRKASGTALQCIFSANASPFPAASPKAPIGQKGGFRLFVDICCYPLPRERTAFACSR